MLMLPPPLNLNYLPLPQWLSCLLLLLLPPLLLRESWLLQQGCLITKSTRHLSPAKLLL